MPENITVRPLPALGRATAFAPTILVKSNLWYSWTEVAIEHEAESLAHRAVSASGETRTIVLEFRSSLVTAVAVAFAFEALHAEIAALLGRDRDPRSWGLMRDTFGLACSPAKGWHAEFEWLFRDLRKQAVHSRPTAHEPIWHESLKTSIARENHAFSAESCKRAVDLLMAVFEALLGPTAKVDPAVQAWAAEQGHVLDRLQKLRPPIASAATP